MAPNVIIDLNGEKVTAYIDTGASATLIAHTVLAPSRVKKLRKYKGTVSDASGKRIPILGEGIAQVNTPAGNFDAYVLVYEKSALVKHEMLLGMNILKHSSIDFKTKELNFSLENKLKRAHKHSPSGLQITIANTTINEKAAMVQDPAAHLVPGDTRASENESTSVSTAAANVCTPLTTEPVYEVKDQEVSAGVNGARAKKPAHTKGKIFDVFLRKDITIEAHTVMLATVHVNKQIANGSEIIMQNTRITDSVALASVVSCVNNNSVKVNLVNVGDDNVNLTHGTKLCAAEYWDADNIVHVPSRTINVASAAESENKPADGQNRPLTSDDVKCDDPQFLGEVLKELNNCRNACWLPGDSIGKYTGDQLEIKMKGNTVVNKAPYRIPYVFQDKLDDYIKKLLDEGAIKRSKSSYNSPLIIVKRADGEIRPCIDYRELNDQIETVSFPLPRITDLLNSLGQSTFISTMDLASAYHQCEIRPDDREKTAFTVKNSKYEWTRVPFGLQSSPGFFARVINEVLYDVLGPQCLAYMDDIVLFSKTAEQHLLTIKNVLQKLLSAGIKLKIQKCRFFADEIKFLGYQVSRDGMTMNRDRVASIQNMPLPANKKQLQSFLGVVNYYRVFVFKFAEIAEPLYGLLRKNAPFLWTHVHTEAINILKEKLASAPIVKFPNYELPFHIHTDASNQGIAAVLMQEHNNMLHPVAYCSKTLNSAQRNYSATKKEALALVYALEYFRHIILLFNVHVYTDHQPLLGVLRKPTKDECLKRWALLVQEYAIKLHYLEGKNNIFADTLSRLPDPTNTTKDLTKQLQDDLNDRNELCNVLQDCNVLNNCNVNALNEYIPEKMPWGEQELRNAQQKDSSCRSIRNLLNNKTTANDTRVPPNIVLNCRVLNGTLYVLRKIKRSTLTDEFLVPYVPDALMPIAFKLMHSDSTAGHKGHERTLKMFTRNFYNAQERKLVHRYCDECELCIRAKKTPKKVPILKYPVPLRPFDTITSDILGPLRLTEAGNQYILTMRDYTTRYTILFPLKYKTTDSIIDALRQVISNYGSSRIMVSDNAAEYTSIQLVKFLQYHNTRKVQIAPYHAASQGLSERINREVNKLLRIYTDQHAIHDWDKLLPVLQLTINNTFNTSIQETPFFALYGYDSATVTLNPPKLNYGEDDLTQHIQRVSKVRQHCRESLLQSQATYTDYTNVGRQPKNIDIGQRVYAKIDKHRRQPKHKLDLPVSGPFIVVNKKGNAWNLKEISTGKSFVVHPDYIIQSALQRQRPPTLANNDAELYLSDDNTVTTDLHPSHSPASPPPVVKPVSLTEDAENVPPPTPVMPTDATLVTPVVPHDATLIMPEPPAIRVQPPRACKK
jgi:hypothetical protein